MNRYKNPNKEGVPLIIAIAGQVGGTFDIQFPYLGKIRCKHAPTLHAAQASTILAFLQIQNLEPDDGAHFILSFCEPLLLVYVSKDLLSQFRLRSSFTRNLIDQVFNLLLV